MGTRTRVATGLVGVLGVATVVGASPAAAAEPHDLSRTDTYHGSYRDQPYTCTSYGRNVLEEDGDGYLRASTDCAYLTVYMNVSYVDETGTTITFSVAGDGYVEAAVHDVASDLAISYHSSQLAGPSTPTYQLPK